MNDVPCCAHCKVVLKHIVYPNGARSDYWECDSGCGEKFIPERWSKLQLERKLDAERKRVITPCIYFGFCLGVAFIAIISLVTHRIHL